MENNSLKENRDDEVIVKFENVNFTYKNSAKKSLVDFNLKIKKGEIIVLTGESGCGKTTVNRCINGLVPEFYDGNLEGRVTVCGMDITKVSLREISRGVGSVFQDPRSQFFTLHVKTEIPFPCENYGLDREEIQNRVRSSIEDLKLESILDRSILNLSSGEKQKLAVASVYALKPKIYVLDEPSANLDGKGTRQLFEVLKILKDRGHTIIISEHKLYYLKDLVDRVVIMKKGKIERIVEGKTFVKKPSQWFEKIGLRQVELETLLIPEVSKNIIDKENTQVLKVDNLAFGYNIGKKLWSNVSFEASEGDIIGIIGKNGVGKSSLARVLMGLEKQRNGKVYIYEKWASKKTRNKNSFYVMQDVDYQLFAPSVLEEMLIGKKVNEERVKKAEEYLKLFNLDDYKEVHPASLSGGQKQRLAIAIACMQDSKFLFLDEPTSGLDAKNMKIVSNILKDLANEGRCIFVITHDYEFALNTFNRLLWFDDKGNFNSLPFHKYSNELLYSKIV
ncbi:energy-coupling factor transport system ATP-binding protein [Clostridium cavendishii DSM 21758]|uniref:Energy-coupling factor transport system ATP-binding protein n=1 Tax=Clostridium cavendishii DSM 21758 TaxID=1121302 RepID=A0A1M6DH93_9CLOT|nr:energy-coupling factor ABC transporter ATP-binding protein [Clostridium cavendishii]SHI72409.1 energy-coupling factor transport system ATP-binding protein [Clostridium cavendishii DSM 21758]